jgi:hypothetical protein
VPKKLPGQLPRGLIRVPFRSREGQPRALPSTRGSNEPEHSAIAIFHPTAGCFTPCWLDDEVGWPFSTESRALPSHCVGWRVIPAKCPYRE